MVNELHEGIASQNGQEVLGAVLEKLLLYIAEHFEYEEALFLATGYCDAEAHRIEHAEMKEKAIEIYSRYKASEEVGLPMEFLDFLVKWMLNHLNDTDRKYTDHLLAHNVT